MNSDELNALEVERFKQRMRQRGKTFDSKCYELAQHFYPEATEAQLNELASDIQDTVETYSEWDKNYDPTPWCTACGARRQAECKCGEIADNE